MKNTTVIIATLAAMLLAVTVYAVTLEGNADTSQSLSQLTNLTIKNDQEITQNCVIKIDGHLKFMDSPSSIDGNCTIVTSEAYDGTQDIGQVKWRGEYLKDVPDSNPANFDLILTDEKGNRLLILNSYSHHVLTEHTFANTGTYAWHLQDYPHVNGTITVVDAF